MQNVSKRATVHGSEDRFLTEVVENVFEHEEEEHLGNDCLPAREGHLPCLHAKELGHGVEEPDDGELDCEVAEQDLLSTSPLLSQCRHLVGLQLPPAEVRDGVDDDPRNGTAKVDNLSEKAVSNSASHKLMARTSCSKNDARPVASTGLPIQRYHEAHWSSTQLSLEKSVEA
jgi:hypothetical protein